MEDHDLATGGSRRRFLRWAGTAATTVGGLALLSACGDDESASPTGATPTPSPTPTAAPSPGPAYTASDADRLNFLLQINYLVGGYFTRGVLGQALPAGTTAGTGTGGSLTGGAQVGFSDATEASVLREITYDVQAQVGRLRALLGGAATAQPAISIAGGAAGPFQAIAATDVFPAASPFDPYASSELFLLGAVALTSLRAAVFCEMVRLMSDKALAGTVAGLSAVASQHDAMIRQALWLRGRTQEALYDRANRMSDARERLDGNRDLDQGIGSVNDANFTVTDFQGVSLRRSPEQVLNVLYANQAAVSSGAFFPAGVNGLIRFSGANTA